MGALCWTLLSTFGKTRFTICTTTFSYFRSLLLRTGHLTKKLIENHFVVTGIDGSAQMIEYARQNAPDAAFIVDDARYFNINEQFEYVISTGDSLNHILKLDELKSVFRNVYSILHSEGTFVFDMNMEKGFLENWALPFTFQKRNMFVQSILHMIMTIKSSHELYTISTWHR